MTWFWIALGCAAVVFVARTVAASRRLATAQRDDAVTPKKKKKAKKTKKTAPEESSPPKALPSTWGWAKLHFKAADRKLLGYYYRDRQAGWSLKVLVDLASDPDEAEIREKARACDYLATTYRIGGHEMQRVEGMGEEWRRRAEEDFAKGEAAPGCAVVIMLTSDERRAYALPEAFPGIEIFA